MPTSVTQRWVRNNSGLLLRRGRVSRGAEAILDWRTDAASMPEGAISLANLRTLTKNPLLPENTAQRGRLSITDIGGDYGKALTIQLIATKTGQNGGVTWVSKLPVSFEAGHIEFDVRFRNGFEWGLGGKILGLGGKTDDISTTPDGGIPSPYGWSGRFMWRRTGGGGGSLPNNAEPVGYLYRPLDEAGSFGVDRHTLFPMPGNATTSDGTWVRFKQVYGMNSVAVEGSSTPPADGINEIWINNVRYYNKTDEIWRLYSPANIGYFLLSSFWGGSTSAWAGTTDGYIDVANLKVMKYY